jgi:hypothetical protein
MQPSPQECWRREELKIFINEIKFKKRWLKSLAKARLFDGLLAIICSNFYGGS